MKTVEVWRIFIWRSLRSEEEQMVYESGEKINETVWNFVQIRIKENCNQ